MPIMSPKDEAAQHDPRRFRMFPPSGISGTADADSVQLQHAYEHLEALHRSPCVLGKTPLVVHRMTVLGIANDLNYVVRALALAARSSGGGQLLLLPPDQAPAHGRISSNNRQALVDGRGIENPWHWFDGLPGGQLSDIIIPSSCHELLHTPREMPRLRALHEMSRRKTNNGSISAVAQSLGLGSKVFDSTKALSALSKGLSFSTIPPAFRPHGMLWWWQALTTYLLRVRGPLALRLQSHPAMRSLLSKDGGMPSSASAIAQYDWLRSSRAALRRATRRAADALGWEPPLAFDAALHVRMGDACGPHAKPHQGVVRKCVRTLRAGLAPLLAHSVIPPGGSLFLATDSQAIIDEAEAAAASLPFSVHYLRFDRTKYDTSAWIELASAKQRSQIAILEETLLDLLTLSRARYLAGSMYGNVPRLALQLRATKPGDARRLAYITTDGRDWCTCPTCMKNNTDTGRFW